MKVRMKEEEGGSESLLTDLFEGKRNFSGDCDC